MKKLFTINEKEIYDIDTTLLFDSKYNYNNDMIAFLNAGCEIVDKNSIKDISEIPIPILEFFHCGYLKTEKDLTKIDELKISVLSSILENKKTIVFFNVLIYLDNDFKKLVIDYLKKQNKRIINYTSEIEETLLLDYLVVIYDNKIIMEGQKEEILKEEKILKKIGFHVPCIVDLSNNLVYYGLIDKIYYDNESLVNNLWK